MHAGSEKNTSERWPVPTTAAAGPRRERFFVGCVAEPGLPGWVALLGAASAENSIVFNHGSFSKVTCIVENNTYFLALAK